MSRPAHRATAVSHSVSWEDCKSSFKKSEISYNRSRPTLPPSLIQKACPVTDEESPPAPLLDVTALALALQRFADDRDWQQFHSPKNLAMALTGEVGELCELFQWMSEADSARAAEHPELGQPLRDELADVFMYLVRLSHVLGVDLNEAVTRKLALNGQKYPVEKAKGSSKKYDQF